ncbi:uncharacterized protein TANIYAMA1_855 [Streptococcus suis]|nr:uncharacterized protein TANIYAMA1_855 [Streptococcus suis]
MTKSPDTVIVKRLQVICNICYIPLSSLQGLSLRIDRAEKHEGIKYYELSNDKKTIQIGTVYSPHRKSFMVGNGECQCR